MQKEQTAASRTEAPSRISLRILTASALLGLPALYFGSFFNRFAGVRSGAGEYSGGLLLLSGVLPYRDYFTAGPPLNTLKSALLLKLFGTTLLVSRSAGVAERLLLCTVLYVWLRRLFRRGPALAASVATTILSAADCTDPIASYNHDAILWSMLSGWLASHLLAAENRTARRSAVRSALLALGSGVCASLAICTKQTVGLAVAGTVLACMTLTLEARGGWRKAAGTMLLFVTGSALPVCAVGLLLARWHLLRSMLQMLFVAGPQAKATHAADFLVREFSVAWSSAGWVILGGAALAWAWRPTRRAFAHPNAVLFGERWGESNGERYHPAEWRECVAILLGGGVLLLVAEVLAFHTSLPALHDVTKAVVYFAFLGITAAAFLSLLQLRDRLRSPQGADLLLMLSVSWAIAASLSLSWPAFEAMLMPGLGLLLAVLLSQPRRRGRQAAYAVVAVAVFLSVREKLDRPFLFDGQQELPVRFASARSSLPELRGMRLPAATVALLDGTTAIVRKHTTPGDTLFTYPEMGLLYALSGHRSPTFAASHNIDVVNDALTSADAAQLLATPPAVIVRYRQSETELQAAETLWREGRPSGQRSMIVALDRLTTQYQLAATYRLAPFDPEIEVYTRQQLDPAPSRKEGN